VASVSVLQQVGTPGELQGQQQNLMGPQELYLREVLQMAALHQECLAQAEGTAGPWDQGWVRVLEWGGP
jgi:hypothetical protein